jgi:hypothetical protein
MAGKADGVTLSPPSGHFRVQPFASRSVETAVRFIEQHERRRVNHRSQDHHSLPLAARQATHAAIGKPLHACAGHLIGDAATGVRNAIHPRRKQQVLANGQLGIETTFVGHQA